MNNLKDFERLQKKADVFSIQNMNNRVEKDRFVDLVCYKEPRNVKKKKMYYLSESLINEVKVISKSLNLKSENEFVEKALKYIIDQIQ